MRFKSLLLIIGALWPAMLIGCASHPSAAEPQIARTLRGQSESPRVVVDLNPDWKFIRQDVPGAEQASFDDSGWQSISLPHTWNNLDGEDGGNDYYRGIGWYRRHLNLADHSELAGKSQFIRFDAASIAADVFINGKPAGSHKGMFSAFCFDVTPLMNPGGDNVIAVRVDNARNPDIPPLSADFTFFGGIYRGVRLLGLNPLSISPIDDASPGVYVKQARVSADRADLEVTTKLHNGGTADKVPFITCDLLDDQDQVVKSFTGSVKIPAGGTADSVQTISLDHPRLWDGRKDPYLYHMRVSVDDGGNIVDRVTQPVGIRFFRVDPEQGFFLNGHSYPLHGVNRHQDRIDMGWAISAQQHQEDFNLIMEMGCTGIRLAHYQHAQEFYDLCDGGGLVVWAEACMVNSVTISQAFDDTAKQQLRELIKQSYNHPSICFWSLFNELGNARPPLKGEALKEQDQHQIDLVTALNQLAHELDPTRLTTAATNRPKPEYPLNLITDVIGFNRYDGWYRKSTSDWPAELDATHAGQPGRAVGISEYGAGASIYQHEVNPAQPKTAGGWHPEEWQCIVHEQAWAAMKQRPYLWGTFLWNMFDFASDGRSEGDHLGINDKGLVSYDRKTRKDAFYFYKANWTTDPFVYITDRRFNPRNVAVGPVKIYSNCDSVELKLNGQSLGPKTVDDHVFVWPDITLNRGENRLEAIGTQGGKQFDDSCTIDFDPGWRPVRPYEPATRPTSEPATQPATQP
jgi:beta-galactosidase